jgi:homoserine O-succinyltransferase
MTGSPLVIGLVNNMPDAALAATERQFSELIRTAAGDLDYVVRLFSLPSVPRSDYARAQMRGRYADVDALMASEVDALIVTGTEPRTPDLKREPYYPQLQRLVDWAERHTLSTVWSCLAAHAAVLHLDGIERRPLERKLSGVFDSEPVSTNGLLADMPGRLSTPHSRLNELDEGDLSRRNYLVLTRSTEAGVDLFLRGGDSLFVFLQGHPEYEANTLAREYLRDVSRYLKGEREVAPPVPTGYFKPELEASLKHLDELADRHRGMGLLTRFMEAVEGQAPVARWRPSAERLYSNWLTEVAARKAERAADRRFHVAGA